MSYLINVKTNEIVTYTNKELKSGELVLVSFDRTRNNLSANRDWDLVNAIECKVSNAKKWAKESNYADSCVELKDNEFYI